MSNNQQTKRIPLVFCDESGQHDCDTPCKPRTIDRAHPLTARLNPVVMHNIAKDAFGKQRDGEMTINGVYIKGDPVNLICGVPQNTGGRYEVIVWCDWPLSDQQLRVRDRVAGSMGKIDKITNLAVRDRRVDQSRHTGFKVVMTEDCSSSDDAILQVAAFLGYIKDAVQRREVRNAPNHPYVSVPFYVS